MSAALWPRRSPLLSLLLLRSYPQARQPWLYALARAGVACGYLYLAVVVALLALEDRLLFSPRTAADYWEPPPPGFEPEDVEITTRDGTRLHGWWSAPPYWTPEQGAFLYLHGNACNLSTLGLSAQTWRDQLNVGVLLIDYPGYGHSEGTASEAGLYAAGDAAYDWLTNEKKVPPKRLLIHGLSLGGGVAVDLASRRPHRALILTSTFTSFPDEAQAVVPFVPARWLVHNQFRNLDKIPQIKTPIFIAHSTTDALIPFSQSQRLYDAATSEHKRFLPIEDGPHDLREEWQIHLAVREFLQEVDPIDPGRLHFNLRSNAVILRGIDSLDPMPPD
jgi:fermentation-respiration switch protein FrsA (DUF1100 family)